jgi:hypothetical protein
MARSTERPRPLASRRPICRTSGGRRGPAVGITSGSGSRSRRTSRTRSSSSALSAPRSGGSHRRDPARRRDRRRPHPVLCLKDATIRRLRIANGRIGTLDLSGAHVAELILETSASTTSPRRRHAAGLRDRGLHPHDGGPALRHHHPRAVRAHQGGGDRHQGRAPMRSICGSRRPRVPRRGRRAARPDLAAGRAAGARVRALRRSTSRGSAPELGDRRSR